MEKTIEIPEGYEARIEGNKVIIEKKESEDERIRKKLYHTVLGTSATDEWFEDISKDKVLAYLEKQKEQKPAEWSEEDERQIRQIERIIKDAGCTAKLQEQIHNWLKSLRPRPHWKPSEEQMEALLLAIEGKWEEIKPTGYMSRRLEDLYEGLANTFKVEGKLEE